MVTAVKFHFDPAAKPKLAYADLKKHFQDAVSEPTPLEVYHAVRKIRQAKGMLLVEGDPDCRSAGSFFKNPVVPVETLAKIAAVMKIEREAIPNWPVLEGGEATGKTKLPAAWLLENVGFRKGVCAGGGGDLVAAYAGADQSRPSNAGGDGRAARPDSEYGAVSVWDIAGAGAGYSSVKSALRGAAVPS